MDNPLPSDVETDCAPTNYEGHSYTSKSNMDKLKPGFGVGKNIDSRCDSVGFDSGFSSLKSGTNSLREQFQQLNIEHPETISEEIQNKQSDNQTKTEQLYSVDEGIGSLHETNIEPDIESLIPELKTSRQQQLLYTQDEDGDTQLHIAIIHKDETAALQIISMAPSHDFINIPNHLGQTPLILAAITKQVELIRRLMIAGASVDHRDRNGNTALHHACTTGSVPCLKALTSPVTYKEVQVNSYNIPHQRIPQDLDTQNYEGFTSLHLSAQAKQYEVMKHLLELGADINAEDGKSGRTILHHTVEARNEKLVDYLLCQPKIDIEARTYDFKTPLCLAIGRGFDEIAARLVYKGADKHMVLSDSEDSEEELMDQYDDFKIGGQPI